MCRPQWRHSGSACRLRISRRAGPDENELAVRPAAAPSGAAADCWVMRYYGLE
jgi:hypothetical protein